MIELRNICRRFSDGFINISALSDINLQISPRDYIAIYGDSGSGKTTLGHILNGCLPPSCGQYFFNGYLVPRVSDRSFFSTHVQSVSRNTLFLDNLSARENIELALSFRKISRAKRRETALYLLKQVGIFNQRDLFPRQLSASQKLRLSLARALASPCELFIADEPTENADSDYADELFCGFSYLQKAGKAVIIMTGKLDVALNAEKIIRLSGGKFI